MDTNKDIHGNKQIVIDAMNELSFEDYIKFIPKPPLLEWQKEFAKSSKELTDKEKDNIFIVSGFICLMKKYYRAFWNPWNISGKNSKLSFRADYIEYAYEKIALELPMFDDDAGTAMINKKYYETCYGYHLAEDFLKGIDEVYWYLSSLHPIIVQKNNLLESRFAVRFDNVSIRGSHRVKIWPTYMWPGGTYSRRTPTGNFYQLNPEDNHFFETEVTSITQKVKWLCRNKAVKSKHCNLIDAIHPHISNGEPCLGGWQSRLNRDSEFGFAQVFMKDLKGYLSTWTINSPFWNINRQYRHTYRFPIFKGRRNAHWDVIDSMYLNINWSRIRLEDWNHNVSRLAMQMKHETGFYTDTFFAKYQDYLILRKINDKRAMDILNEIHGIKVNNTEVHKSSGKLLDEIGYGKIWRLQNNDWSLKENRLPLSNCYSNLNLRFSFTDLIQRTKSCIRNYINHDLDIIHWMEIMEFQSSDVNYRIIAEKLSSGTQGNVDKINEIYLKNFRSCSPEEFDKRTFEEDYPWEKDDYYNAHILKMLNDYKYFERFLDGWIKQSYEREIDRLTNLTKEFSDELTNYTSSAGQSELFPQSISN